MKQEYRAELEPTSSSQNTPDSQMRDDNLTTLDVLEAIRNFEVIEEYPTLDHFLRVYFYVGKKARNHCMWFVVCQNMRIC